MRMPDLTALLSYQMYRNAQYLIDDCVTGVSRWPKLWQGQVSERVAWLAL